MSYCILAIDDDQGIHRIIDDLLRPEGFEVLHAKNGLEGLTTAMSTPVDLIVLDINMPVMDGFKTLDALRNKTRTRDLPILMLSSHGTEAVKVRGLELGADDYIVKPFQPAEFLARVRSALRRSERYRRDENVFQGDLADISMPELVQTMALGNKSGLLLFPDIEAQFFFNKGELALASCMNFTGEEALLRALFLEKGQFAVEFMPYPETMVGMELPTQHLLMAAVAYVDELRLMLQNACPLDAVADVSGSGLAAVRALGLKGPVPIAKLIALLEGDLKQNAEAVFSEIHEGRIRCNGNP